MSFRAANPAGFSHLSPCLTERANRAIRHATSAANCTLLTGALGGPKVLAMAAAFLRQYADENFALERVCRFVSRLCSGTASGFSCALRQLALLLRLRRPAGYGFPPNLVRKERRKDFSGPSVNAELRHLGARPTRLMVPRSRSGNSTNGDNYVSEQSNSHRLSRQQPRSAY
jgi:hypothetical protein